MIRISCARRIRFGICRLFFPFSSFIVFPFFFACLCTTNFSCRAAFFHCLSVTVLYWTFLDAEHEHFEITFVIRIMDNVRRRSDLVIVNMDEIEKSNDNVEYQGLEAPINTSCPEISTISWIIPRPTLMRTYTDNGHEIITEHIFKQGNTFPTNLLLAVPASSTNNRNQSISSTTSCSSNSSSKVDNLKCCCYLIEGQQI